MKQLQNPPANWNSIAVEPRFTRQTRFSEQFWDELVNNTWIQSLFYLRDNIRLICSVDWGSTVFRLKYKVIRTCEIKMNPTEYQVTLENLVVLFLTKHDLENLWFKDRCLFSLICLLMDLISRSNGLYIPSRSRICLYHLLKKFQKHELCWRFKGECNFMPFEIAEVTNLRTPKLTKMTELSNDLKN